MAHYKAGYSLCSECVDARQAAVVGDSDTEHPLEVKDLLKKRAENLG